jgi:hypothetical protein
MFDGEPDAVKVARPVREGEVTNDLLRSYAKRYLALDLAGSSE